MTDFINKYYLEVWTNTFNYKGRTRRIQFLAFEGIYLLISILIFLFALNGMDVLANVTKFVGFLHILPRISLIVRRLHDTNKSGWFFFISFIPLVGSFILLIFLLMDSKPGTNRYGENPKEKTCWKWWIHQWEMIILIHALP